MRAKGKENETDSRWRVRENETDSRWRVRENETDSRWRVRENEIDSRWRVRGKLAKTRVAGDSPLCLVFHLRLFCVYPFLLVNSARVRINCRDRGQRLRHRQTERQADRQKGEGVDAG